MAILGPSPDAAHAKEQLFAKPVPNPNITTGSRTNIAEKITQF